MNVTKTFLNGALLLISIGNASAATGPEIAKRAFASTVILLMEDANRQPVTIGSGFFVTDRHVATNVHVVKNAKYGSAKIVGDVKKYEVVGVSALDEDHDLAILELRDGSGPTLSLSKKTLEVGEEVYAVGNPQGLEGTFSKGIVSGIRNLKNGNLIQITAPISPGSSGGPVLNLDGEVVGIAVAAYRDGQNLNFAIPTFYLESLLKKIGPALPLNPDVSKKVGSSVHVDGQLTEGVVGLQFAWSSVRPFKGFWDFSFSLKNQLRNSVMNIECLVIFYDDNGEPLETVPVVFKGEIYPGMTKRVTEGRADKSLQSLAKRIEIRVLNFNLH